MKAESQSESRTTFSAIPGFPARITAAAARKSSAFSIFPMIRKGSKTPFYPHCAASKLNGFDTSEEVLKKGRIYYDGGRLQ